MHIIKLPPDHFNMNMLTLEEWISFEGQNFLDSNSTFALQLLKYVLWLFNHQNHFISLSLEL